jgi:hypothetical protein
MRELDCGCEGYDVLEHRKPDYHSFQEEGKQFGRENMV